MADLLTGLPASGICPGVLSVCGGSSLHVAFVGSLHHWVGRYSPRPPKDSLVMVVKQP